MYVFLFCVVLYRIDDTSHGKPRTSHLNLEMHMITLVVILVVIVVVVVDRRDSAIIQQHELIFLHI